MSGLLNMTPTDILRHAVEGVQHKRRLTSLIKQDK